MTCGSPGPAMGGLRVTPVTRATSRDVCLLLLLTLIAVPSAAIKGKTSVTVPAAVVKGKNLLHCPASRLQRYLILPLHCPSDAKGKKTSFTILSVTIKGKAFFTLPLFAIKG